MEKKFFNSATIQQTANVEVINVTASLVAKAIKVDASLGELISRLKSVNKVYKKDENGEICKDANGGKIVESEKVDYNSFRFEKEDAKMLAEKIYPFIHELAELWDID